MKIQLIEKMGQANSYNIAIAIKQFNSNQGMEKKKKVDSLSSVDDPLKVKVLILAQQKTSFQDFFFINAFVNVVKIDLSYNKLTSFPSGFSFNKFPKLKILFLHYNKFSNHKNLSLICNSSTLEYLTLFGNPIEQTKTRHFFVNKISSLKLMDDKIVKIEERFPQLLLEQKNPISLKVPFPLVATESSQLSSSFLSIVIEELRIIRRKFVQANPLLKIQRWFRKMLKKKQQISYSYFKKSEGQKEEKVPEKRLVTEKYENSKIKQLKITSLFKTNFQFLKIIKSLCHTKIYALKSFCQSNSIAFETVPELYCLRNGDRQSNKKFIQFLLENNQNFLIRRKGLNISMNYKKKYVLLRKIKVGKKQQTSYQLNSTLSIKLEEKRKSYENVFVQVSASELFNIFPLVKQCYFDSIKGKAKFPFIFSPFWQRKIAAISIQRMWRGYKVRKGLSLPNILLRNAAAIRIQKWIRKLAFKNKQNFMLDSYFYIKEETNSFIVIPSKVLLKLEDVIKKNNSAINFVFPEQKMLNFTYRNEGRNVCLPTTKRIYPPHFNQHLSLKTYLDQQTLQKNPSFILYTLLFKGAVQVSSFEREHQYTKIEYCSQSQARNRKYLLALATYSFGKKSFLKSCEFETGNKAFRIEERIEKEIFMGYELPKKLENRFDKQYKIKYFQKKEDLTKSIKIAFPVGYTLAHPPNHKIINSQRSLFGERSNYSSAKISKNVLSLQNNYNLTKKAKRYNDFSSITVKGTEGFELEGPINESRTQNVRAKVYDTEDFVVHDKKEKVQFVRNSHREKIQANRFLKKEELKKIRKEINEQEKKQQISIKMNKIQNLMSNVRKHNFIKSKLTPKSEQFEKQFLTRGNSSIKKEMVRHEKSSKSSDNSSILSGSNSMKHHLVTKPSKRYVNLKTDIKQFSMNISETDLSLGNIPIEQNEKEGKEEEEVSDKKKQTRNIQFNSVETFEVAKRSKEQRKKKDRKKKIVHSVFPEEFYPLKQSKKLGFQLPKIKR